MSQDALLSRQEKKAKRSEERHKKGTKRKRTEVENDGETAEKSEVAPDFVPLDTGSAEDTANTQRIPKKKKKSTKATADPLSAAEDGQTAPTNPKPKKRRKRTQEAANNPSTTAVEPVSDPPKTDADAAPDKPTKSRFIVFVGNLPYTTTDASLSAHFKSLLPFTLRHRTDPKTKKSKGFAFLEFEGYDRMKTCLKLYHHSMFDPEDGALGGKGKGNGKGGRRINVELTAGGGGKGKERKEKIKVKNVRLEEQRVRRAEAEIKEKGKKGGKGGQEEAPVAEDAVQEVGEAEAGMHPSRLAMMKR